MEGGAGGEEKEEGEAGAWGVGGREGERGRGEAVKTKIAACGSQPTDMIDDIHPTQKRGQQQAQVAAAHPRWGSSPRPQG